MVLRDVFITLRTKKYGVLFVTILFHDKLKFNKGMYDKMWLSNLEIMLAALEKYQFTAIRYLEDDRSATLSLNEIDIIENGKDDKEVRLKTGKTILEYSIECHKEYDCFLAVLIERDMFHIFLWH